MGDPTALGTPHSRPGTRLRQGTGTRHRTRHPAPGTQHRTQHPAPGTRHFSRPPPPEVGRRQAAAPARAARVLSRIVRPLLRAVCRQRRRVLRSLRERTAGRRASDADRLQRRSDRVLPDGARSHGGGAACAGAPGARSRGGRRRALLRGARAIQPDASAPGRPTGRRRLHAGAGRDADLLEPHGVQRAVPPERSRALQRAGGPLRAAADLRPGAPGGRRRGAWRPGRQPASWRPFESAVGAARAATWCTSIRRTRR